MSSAELVFKKEFHVRYHELDCNGSVQPVALLNYVQDAAGMHAKQLGVSVSDLRLHGLTWVLARIHLIVEHYPRARESVLVHTWPSTRHGLFSCREYELFDWQGRIMGRATTSWAVLDVASRRPVKLEGNLPPYPLLPRRAIDDEFPSLPQLPDPRPAGLSFRVLRSDLDINHHVNNAVYVGWALEAVPDEVAAGSLVELEISFRAEVRYGETIESRCTVVESGEVTCCLHQIVNRLDGKELARLRTRWRV